MASRFGSVTFDRKGFVLRDPRCCLRLLILGALLIAGVGCSSAETIWQCAADRDCRDGYFCCAGACREEGFQPPPGTLCRAGEGEGECEGECEPQASEPCGPAVGECSPGTRSCDAQGHWGACLGGVGAVAEICDGRDNDCDGGTDEELSAPVEFSCLGGGVCEGTTPVCQGVAGWGCPYPAGYEVIETTCDGQDNDCDGGIDEELSTPAEFSCLGVGVCEGTEPVCQGVAGWGCPYPAGYEAIETTCDGRDNDCDEATDEADALVELPWFTCPTAGVCAGVVPTCEAGGWRCPEPEGYEAVEITCDGRDNDCDGSVDEGLVPPRSANQAGICAGSVQVCHGQAGWAEPVFGQLPEFEEPEQSCDGLDNDCDGMTDEELEPPDCPTQGVCAQTEVRAICRGAAGWLCFALDPRWEEQERTCDAADNDCDGRTDEELVPPLAEAERCQQDCRELGAVAGKICCREEDGVAAARCQAGAWRCLGVANDLLEIDPATPYQCDGVDNDCDGQTDEGCAPYPAVFFADDVQRSNPIQDGIDFGEVRVGENRPIELILRNTGAQRATIQKLELNPPTLEFHVTLDEEDACGKEGPDLEASAECSFAVRLSPEWVDLRQASLQIELANGTKRSISLSGVGGSRVTRLEIQGIKKWKRQPSAPVLSANRLFRALQSNDENGSVWAGISNHQQEWQFGQATYAAAGIQWVADPWELPFNQNQSSLQDMLIRQDATGYLIGSVITNLIWQLVLVDVKTREQWNPIQTPSHGMSLLLLYNTVYVSGDIGNHLPDERRIRLWKLDDSALSEIGPVDQSGLVESRKSWGGPLVEHHGLIALAGSCELRPGEKDICLWMQSHIPLPGRLANFEGFAHRNISGNEMVSGMCSDGQNIWIVAQNQAKTDSKLLVYRDGTEEEVLEEACAPGHDLDGTQVEAIAVHPDGMIYMAGTSEGKMTVWSYHPVEDKCVPHDLGDPETIGQSLIVDRSGTLWVGGQSSDDPTLWRIE